MSGCAGCPYWVVEGVGGCHIVCPETLETLRRHGVGLVVSLVEDWELLDCWSSVEDYAEALSNYGIRLVRLPVPDGGAPDVDAACRVVREVAEFVRRGGKAVFHCYAGQGRTGTMLAAYLVAVHCMSLDRAMAVLWRANPCAGPQDPSQELFLYYFAQSCRCR